MNLYSRAQQLYGTHTANRISAFFNDVQLPMPSDGEFSETEDKGFLVFLNTKGVVIRLTQKNRGQWDESRRVLHSLGSRETGKLRADINPGIPCPMTEQQQRELIDGLHGEKLDLNDPGLYNGGTLPAVSQLIREGYAVAIDPIAVSDLSSEVSQVRKWLTRKFMPASAAVTEAADDPQAILYGPLKTIFRSAWQNGGVQPDASKIKLFWQEAQRMKEAKLLAASWLTPEMADRNYKNAWQGSQRYEMHCRNSGFR